MSAGERVVGYVRGSRGAGTGASLEAQRAAIGAECERRGWRLLRLEADRLVRGKAGRPGRARVLAACGAGEARALVRSSRSISPERSFRGSETVAMFPTRL